jgi:hypothetical protein
MRGLQVQNLHRPDTLDDVRATASIGLHARRSEYVRPMRQGA